MDYSLIKKYFITALVFVTLLFGLVNIGQRYAMAAKETHNFALSSGIKNVTDRQPGKVSFIAKHPGTIKIEASWTPEKKKLTVTLYDQKKDPIVIKRGKSPIQLDYEYSQDIFKNAKIYGNTFTVEISQPLFKTIRGTINIETPGQKEGNEKKHTEIKSSFGTFIEK